MIPTRLNQRFNCGTVAGFKKETGEIILVADRAVYVDDYYSSEFEQIQSETLQQYPAGYKWPSVAEIKTLDRRTIEFCFSLKQKFLSTQITDLEFWLVTRDYISETKSRSMSFYMYFLKYENNQLTESCYNYVDANGGWLCPIALIKVD